MSEKVRFLAEFRERITRLKLDQSKKGFQIRNQRRKLHRIGLIWSGESEKMNKRLPNSILDNKELYRPFRKCFNMADEIMFWFLHCSTSKS